MERPQSPPSFFLLRENPASHGAEVRGTFHKGLRAVFLPRALATAPRTGEGEGLGKSPSPSFPYMDSEDRVLQGCPRWRFSGPKPINSSVPGAGEPFPTNQLPQMAGQFGKSAADSDYRARMVTDAVTGPVCCAPGWWD